MTVSSARLLAAAAYLVAGVSAIATHVPEPNPALNANPTDTSNPRLVGKQFAFNALPPHVDTSGTQPGVVFRGPQAGFNICNSTTEGQTSMCQTLQINSISDFCIWAPPTPNSTIGDTEGIEVAWCSKKGHGARLIPGETITGLQFVKTPSYVMMTGNLKLANVNVLDDGGGEMDSGGQDQRGNPIGGAAYSNSLPSANGQLTQSRSWHFFIGGGVFCMKFCDLTAPDAAGLCQHIYDTIGCNYNVPAAYQDGVFLSCLGEDQDPVGIFTGADGQVTTFPNPPEGVFVQPPFVARIPATSQCTTFQSAQIFTDQTSLSSSTTTSSSSTPSGSTPSPAPTSGAGSTSSSPAATKTGAARPGAGVPGSSALVASLVAVAGILIGAAVVA